MDSARVETINAVEAFLGSLPGHGVENIRRFMLNSLNLADLMPTTAVWAGAPKNPCPFYPPDSPPLLHAATNGNTPFRVSAHVGDVGHVLGLGPTGSGKTTLVGLMVAQHFRYPNSQVFAFDMKYGLYGLCKASGGIHYDMGREDSQLSFAHSKTLMIGLILLGLQNGLKPSAHCKAWLLLRPCATKSRTHLSC